MTTAIVGGGIMGMTVGYLLACRGVTVHVFEHSPVLGGLAGPMTLQDGTEVDRFYHAILSTDEHLRALCQELGIAEHLRFRPTRTGVYIGGGIHQMSDIWQFLRFPPLNPVDRLRLGLTIFSAQRTKSWEALEAISLEDYLVARSGRRLFDTFWAPMLNAKFDGEYDHVPATWMWSRFVRTTAGRKGVRQQELTGHLVGGYATLMKAMADKITSRGGRVHLNTPVQEVVVSQGSCTGLRLTDGFHAYNRVVLTMQMPVAARLLPGAPPSFLDALTRIRYLGIVCPLLVLDRPLSDFWVTNVADRSVPLTGVIETTSYIDTAYVGGHHLVYAPKYTAPDSTWMKASDEDIRAHWMNALTRMFPTLRSEHVKEFRIHRERFVEPLRDVTQATQIPGVQTPIQHLHLVTTAQIYPALTNGESVTAHARRAAGEILGGLAETAGQVTPRPAA
jgi:protoporphyrinogen oxidase